MKTIACFVDCEDRTGVGRGGFEGVNSQGTSGTTQTRL